MATNLDSSAQAGYRGDGNGNLFSSPMYYAYCLGQMFVATGRCTPVDVRMGRGYSIHANGMLFKISDDKGTTFTRIK